MYQIYNTEYDKLGRILDNNIGLILNENEVLLNVFKDIEPEYDPETQRVVHEEPIVDLSTESVHYPIIVVDKTSLEIERESWIGTYEKRIKAPVSLITDPNDDFALRILNWFQALNLPTETVDDYIYLYCNEIRPEHRYIVDMYQGTITIEDYPV